MKNFLKALVITILSGAVFSACERETEVVDIDFGYEYFPLQIGQSLEYVVDSIIYDPAVSGTQIDTNSWQVKETVIDSFLALDGQVWYRIERFQRQTEAQPWQIEKVFATARTPSKAFRTEDNLQFTKMIFPIRANASWDGNAAFPANVIQVEVAGEQVQMFKDWGKQMVLSVDAPFQIADATFPNVLTIQLANSDNLVEYRQGKEYYAKGIGLIYRELQILDTQCQACCNGNTGACIDTPWTERAEKGFILRQRITKWQ